MTEEAGLIEVEANYLESLASQLAARAKELREAGKRIARDSYEANLAWKLENLPYRPAKSGKCDWIPAAEVPEELRTLFDSKGEFRSEKYHFVTTKDRNVLRFERKDGAAK
jgi:hypothetical protein